MDMSEIETIAQTIRQQAPLDPFEVETLLTLVRASDLARDRAESPLRSRDLSMPQYNILRILRGSPTGLQTHQVAERLISRAPNLTRLVDKLEQKGFLRRSRSRSDRRVVTLTVTAAGLALLDELDRPVRAAVQDAMRGLDAEAHGRLCDLLNRLRHPLEMDYAPSRGCRNGGRGDGQFGPDAPESSITHQRPRLARRRAAHGDSSS